MISLESYSFWSIYNYPLPKEIPPIIPKDSIDDHETHGVRKKYIHTIFPYIPLQRN